MIALYDKVLGGPVFLDHGVPFSSYLTLNNILTLKSGLELTQGHRK